MTIINGKTPPRRLARLLAPRCTGCCWLGSRLSLLLGFPAGWLTFWLARGRPSILGPASGQPGAPLLTGAEAAIPSGGRIKRTRNARRTGKSPRHVSHNDVATRPCPAAGTVLSQKEKWYSVSKLLCQRLRRWHNN